MPPYDVPVHSVKIIGDSPLYKLLNKETLMVNSYHHQAICKLAPKVSAMAVSEDGLIEAVCVPKKRVYLGDYGFKGLASVMADVEVADSGQPKPAIESSHLHLQGRRPRGLIPNGINLLKP